MKNNVLGLFVAATLLPTYVSAESTHSSGHDAVSDHVIAKPGYNEKGSPFHVSWSVRPKVAKVNIETVGNWCKGNTFKEDHAHGVRNLVTNHDLLSEITK